MSYIYFLGGQFVPLENEPHENRDSKLFIILFTALRILPGIEMFTKYMLSWALEYEIHTILGLKKTL